MDTIGKWDLPCDNDQYDYFFDALEYLDPAVEAVRLKHSRCCPELNKYFDQSPRPIYDHRGMDSSSTSFCHLNHLLCTQRTVQAGMEALALELRLISDSLGIDTVTNHERAAYEILDNWGRGQRLDKLHDPDCFCLFEDAVQFERYHEGRKQCLIHQPWFDHPGASLSVQDRCLFCRLRYGADRGKFLSEAHVARDDNAGNETASLTEGPNKAFGGLRND